MRFVGHAKPALVLVAGVTLLAAVGAAAAQTPEQKLVHTYAPVMKLKANEHLPCSTAGEQYTVTSVDVILRNHDVQLVRVEPGKKAQIVKRGATAADIGGLGSEYYLNQPGDPYHPDCRYARDSQRLTRGRTPVVYAHVVREPGRRGIALQYWFYYWFNRFNDLHESDWEGIQLAFVAETVEGALAVGPSEIAYAQHGGGERADWDDSKVEKDDTHPVVYSSSGSHASQYESALYLGRGRQGSGLGCDDTRGGGSNGDLHMTVRPTPILVPTRPTSSRGNFAWLAYRGHWGQHARGFSNGVTGPKMKERWHRPFTWMAGLRTSTPKMPISNTAGPTVTSFFCGAIIAITNVTNYVGNRMWVMALLLVGVLALPIVPIRRTRWRPAPTDPLRQQRAAGQLLGAACKLYGGYLLSLLTVVLLLLAIVVATTRILQLLADRAGLVFELPLGDPGLDNFSSFVIAAPAYPVFLSLVGAPIMAVLRRIDAGERAVPWAALREVIPLLPRLLWAELLALVAVALLTATVIGIPYAIKKAVDWTFAGQEIVFERRKARAALSASSNHVRGRWWSIAGVDVALFFVGAVIGPLLAATLIVVTGIPLWTINFIGLIFFGLSLPYMIITLTLMYLDPRRQKAPAPRALRRRLAFWRRDAPIPAKAGT
jgi:hypothetical protein